LRRFGLVWKERRRSFVRGKIYKGRGGANIISVSPERICVAPCRSGKDSIGSAGALIAELSHCGGFSTFHGRRLRQRRDDDKKLLICQLEKAS
jgi:hypothetical protein